jgi:hypothetical protein
VENIFRDGKLGAALRHLPSGYPQVNMLTRHARHLVLRLPPGHELLPEVLAGYGNCPAQPDLRLLSLDSPSSSAARQPRPEGRSQTANPAPVPGRKHACYQESWRPKIIYEGSDQLTALFAESDLMTRMVALGGASRSLEAPAR